MRRIATATVLAAALAALSTSPVVAQQRPEVGPAAEAVREAVIGWRRDFHQHPELSNREQRTAAVVADHLRALGLEPRIGIAHHGVVAIIKGGKPGPRLALRADMDALPVTEQVDLPFASKVTTTFNGQETGVMHACGHDAHTAILMGVAQALVAMREDVPGEIMLVFQPAEEGPPPGEEGGAGLMLAQGLFTDFKPEAIFGLHVFSTVPVGSIALRSGPLMAASDRFDIHVQGRQTHGSRPWGGIDPIVASAGIVNTLQTVVSRRTDIAHLPAVVTVGVVRGGIRYNIIPDAVEMQGTLRTFDDGMRKAIIADMRNVIEHSATAQGASARLVLDEAAGNPVTYNDPTLTARMLPSLRAVVGADKVGESPLQMGAEDFSLYARQVPGLFFFVGATAAGVDPATAPSNHSPLFQLDEGALDVGVRALLQLALDFQHGTTPGG